MRVKLEVGSWRLVEDDSGEVRLWSHLESGETREEDDIPDEVKAYLRSQQQQREQEEVSKGQADCQEPAASRSSASWSDAPAPRPPPNLDELPVKKPNLKVLASGMRQWPRPDKPPEQLLPKVTHMFLAERGLTVLGDAVHQHCHALKVLQLEGNRLHAMGKLPASLETLQLEGNRLWEIDSWSQKLPRLEVLDLRGNNISVVEGLQGCVSLRNLVLRGQSTAMDVGLYFNRRSLQAIAPGLRLLDVARNHLTSISPLACLTRLERLDASHNALASVEDVSPVIAGMSELANLILEGNPLTSVRRYRDDIVRAARSLEELDGKPVGRSEHAFLGELDRRRQMRRPRNRGPSAPPRLSGEGGSPLGQSGVGSGRPRSYSKALPPIGHPGASGGGLPPLPGGKRMSPMDPQAMPRMATQRRQSPMDRF